MMWTDDVIEENRKILSLKRIEDVLMQHDSDKLSIGQMQTTMQKIQILRQKI